MTVEIVIKELAFGGCSLYPSARYSIVGHPHRDHIPKNPNITVVGPVHLRNRNHIYIHYDEWFKLHLDSNSVIVHVLGRKALRSIGINKKLHTNPILLYVKSKDCTEIALYIDDIDVDDIQPIKTLINFLKRTYGDRFKAVLLPVYNRNKAHGAQDYTELHNKSIELINYALEFKLNVYALAHPVIPPTLPPNVVPVPKLIETIVD